VKPFHRNFPTDVCCTYIHTYTVISKHWVPCQSSGVKQVIIAL